MHPAASEVDEGSCWSSSREERIIQGYLISFASSLCCSHFAIPANAYLVEREAVCKLLNPEVYDLSQCCGEMPLSQPFQNQATSTSQLCWLKGRAPQS